MTSLSNWMSNLSAIPYKSVVGDVKYLSPLESVNVLEVIVNGSCYSNLIPERWWLIKSLQKANNMRKKIKRIFKSCLINQVNITH